MSFSHKIISWYNQNKRDLPWRVSHDPYSVWLSEIILQQTRVAQGTPYFLKIREKFPDVAALAASSEQEVLSLWQGLGYYSRGRNLHACARQVVAQYNGEFPKSSVALQKLKGIGKYTSAAIASICFNEPIPVIDGNVYRVLSRYFNLEQDISESKAYKVFEEVATSVIDKQQPGTFNQAMMEFGALQCVPQNPDCLNCPLIDSCESFNLKNIDQRPVKTKKVKVKKRFFDYLVLHCDEGVLLKERKKGDIWQGLYDFPLIERSNDKQILESEMLDKIEDTDATLLYSSDPVKHILTHQLIQARFHEYRISQKVKAYFIENYGLNYFSFAEISELPKPVLVSNYLKSGVKYLALIK